MQNGPSQVTSGNIAPAISGPRKDKDVLVVSGLVASLAVVIGAFWYYSSADQTTATNPDRLDGSQVSEMLKSSRPLATSVSFPSNKGQESPIARSGAGTIHTDLYFEVGRKGLTDEARTLLQEQATLLKSDGNLGVLVQGYTDAQGSASYNLKLGMKRAETVKAELINAGVAAHQIKVVSLGKEGVLCIDSSDVCRHMNRRVHLEIRTIGQDHMVAPVVAATPAVDATQASVEPVQPSNEPGSLIDSLLPSAGASEGGSGDPLALEPASGS